MTTITTIAMVIITTHVAEEQLEAESNPLTVIMGHYKEQQHLLTIIVMIKSVWSLFSDHDYDDNL